jgi:hypothetical protein
MVSSENSNSKNRGKRATVKKKLKKFEEHEMTEPIQLSLFKFLDQVEPVDTDKYSQTIELYDFMPKYVWDRRAVVKSGEVPPAVMREFECRSVRRLLAIHPASMIDPDTRQTKYEYPGKSEQLVEEVLRKLAVDGGGKFLDNSAAVKFSIYQVRKELEKHGHKMSHNQIRESLDILALTRLELINIENKKDKVIFSPIENLGICGEGDETQTFVIFSPLVTQSILQTTFRLYNYKQVMSYKSAISRLLHKRMAHHFTQASMTTKYTISVSTLIQDFGLTPQSRVQWNLKDIEKALIEMKTGFYPKGKKKDDEKRPKTGSDSVFRSQNILLDYKIDPVYDATRKNKIVDYHIHLTPSNSFAGETIKANKIEKNNRQKNTGDRGEAFLG